MKTSILFLVLTAGFSGFAAEAADSAAAVARGRDIYMKVGCYHCHGTQGQGSGAGLKLSPEPLPAGAIAQFIRGTTGPMPAYSEKILPDAQVADIAAFLRSIPASRSADSIPLLKGLKPTR